MLRRRGLMHRVKTIRISPLMRSVHMLAPRAASCLAHIHRAWQGSASSAHVLCAVERGRIARRVHVSFPGFPCAATLMQQQQTDKAHMHTGFGTRGDGGDGDTDASGGGAELASSVDAGVLSEGAGHAAGAERARAGVMQQAEQTAAGDDGGLHASTTQPHPAFLRAQGHEWRAWQAQVKQRRAARLLADDPAEIERVFRHDEAVGLREEAGAAVGHQEAANTADTSTGHNAPAEMLNSRTVSGGPSLGTAALRGDYAGGAGLWAVAEEKGGGEMMRSSAKERKQQRRRDMLAKAVRVHLTSALRSGLVTKRRTDLEYLSLEVHITSVLMSSDVGHATVLWTPVSAADPKQVDKIEKDLLELKVALRAVLARELNIRRCPDLTLRPDPGWLASIRAQESFDKIAQQRAMWASGGGEGVVGESTAGGVRAGERDEGADVNVSEGGADFSAQEIAAMEALLEQAETAELFGGGEERAEGSSARSGSVGARVRRLLDKIREAAPPAQS